MALKPISSLGHLIVEVSRSHTGKTHTQSVVQLWKNDQPVAEAATYTINARDEHPCHQSDSNAQSQQSSGFRPTP